MAGLILRLLIGIGISVLLIWTVGLSQLIATLSRLNPFWLAMAFAAQVVGKFVWATRWSALLKIFHLHFPFSRLVKGIYVGLFFSNFLPTSIGGDLYRSYWILDETKQYPKSIFIVFVERLIGIISLGYVALLPFLWLLSQRFEAREPALLILLILAPLCAGIFALHPAVFDFFDRLLRRKVNWLARDRRRISEALHRLDDAGPAKWQIFLLSVAVHVVGITFFYTLGRGLNLPLTIWHYFIIVPLTVVATTLPISFNGLGIREAALVFLTAALGTATSPSQAITLGLLSSAVTITVSLLGALFYTVGERKEVYVAS